MTFPQYILIISSAIVITVIAVVVLSAIEYFKTERKVDWYDQFKDRPNQSDEVKKANAEMRRKIKNK